MIALMIFTILIPIGIILFSIFLDDILEISCWERVKFIFIYSSFLIFLDIILLHGVILPLQQEVIGIETIEGEIIELVEEFKYCNFGGEIKCNFEKVLNCKMICYKEKMK